MAQTHSRAGLLSARQVAPVVLMVFANSFGQNLIFPFLPFMVKDFLDVPRNKVGFYSGFLASAFFFGNFIGSLMWGAAADRFGRRPTLLTSVSLTMVWILLFGFSQSYSWAVIARFLWGLSSGVEGFSKTVLSESSTSATAARTFSFIGFSSGLGRLMGPAIGGLLVGLIPDFPYILPLLVCLSVSAVSLILGLIFLKETLVKRSIKGNKTLPEWQSQDHEHVELLPSPEIFLSTTNGEVLQNGKANTSNTTTSDHEHRSDKSSWRCCLFPRTAAPYVCVNESATTRLNCYSCCKNIVNVLYDYARLLKDRVIRTVCIVYTMLTLTAVMHYELIPLLLVVNFAHGGLCLNSAELGIILAVAGVVQLLIQLFLYPQLSKRFSYRHIFQGGMIGLAVCMILFPWTSYFTGNQDPVQAVDNRRRSLTDLHPTPIHWSNNNSEWSTFFSQPPSALPYNMSFDLYNTSDQLINRAHTQPFLENTNRSVATDICLGSKGIIGNDTDECGRPLATSGKSRTVNYKLIKCLAWRAWLIVLVITGGGFWFRTVSFTSVNILINNSCEMDVRARVNGLSMSMSAVGCLLGPLIISNLFAVTDTNSPQSTFSIEHHIPAWLTAISAILAALWCLRLPSSIEKKKVTASAEPKEARHPCAEDKRVALADDEEDNDDTELSGEHVELIRRLRTNNCEQDTSV